MNKFDLETPAIVVDLDRLEENIKMMAERVRSAGVRLRPHTKTHKTQRSRACSCSTGQAA